MKVESKEKDMLISQLKAHIFELTQHEKDYDNLNQKYRQLQNEYSLLNETKMRQDYEFRQRDENANKQINDLRNENENLQLNYNEKLAVNKKLFNENDTQNKQLSMKDEEIDQLRCKIENLLGDVEKGQEDRNSLERLVQSLTDLKDNQGVKISKLIEDNQKLSKICQDQDRAIKLGEQERAELSNKINESNYDMKNLTGKLQSKEENLNYLQGQLDDTKNMNMSLQSNLKDYERQFQSMQDEIANLKDNLMKERQARAEEEKRSQHMENIINDRERELNKVKVECDNIKNFNKQVSQDKMGTEMENEKLKNHIMLLTQQNSKLIAEIENVCEQDERMKEQLSRKDRIVSLLRNNRNSIEMSLKDLGEFLGRSTNSIGGNQTMTGTLKKSGMASSGNRYTYNRTSPSLSS